MLALALTTLATTGSAPGELEVLFRAQAAGNWIDADVGHAAPLVVDWDGDGLEDLLVGQFGEGRLRIYRNEGRAGAPKFGDFEWFQTEDGPGKVPVG